MKKIAAIICMSALAACNQQNVQQKDDTMVFICGKIENPEGNIARLMNTDKTDTLYIDTAGQFSHSLSIDKEGYFTFWHGDEYARIYLSPGDSIFISLNTEKFDESLIFSGKGAAPNNYLISNLMLGDKLEKETPLPFDKEKNRFVEVLDSQLSVNQQNLESFLNPDISERFILFEKAKLLYGWAVNMINYADYYKYYNKVDSVDLGENFDGYLSKLNINDSLLLDISAYKTFITIYMSNLAAKEYEKDSALKKGAAGLTIAKFSIIETLFTDESVKNYLYYSSIKDQYNYYGMEGTDKLAAEFVNKCTNQEYKNEIKELGEKWKTIAKGNIAPDFTYPDIDSNMIALSDFKGKYVYIDVWATWCGPCKREIPHLEKLQEKFKGKNIAFMSVSVDDDKDAWKNMVREKGLKGTQLYGKGWTTKIAEDYLIKSIPRFILIDREGNIIDADAPRPSGEISDILSKLDGIKA